MIRGIQGTRYLFTIGRDNMTYSEAEERLKLHKEWLMSPSTEKALDMGCAALKKQDEIKKLIEEFSNEDEMFFYRTDASGVVSILKGLLSEELEG